MIVMCTDNLLCISEDCGKDSSPWTFNQLPQILRKVKYGKLRSYGFMTNIEFGSFLSQEAEERRNAILEAYPVANFLYFT